MKRMFVALLASMIAGCAIVSFLASDVSAQSGGRRGADARCRHGGTVQGMYYCNLKHAPPGPWNNYNSTGRYKQRPGMENR